MHLPVRQRISEVFFYPTTHRAGMGRPAAPASTVSYHLLTITPVIIIQEYENLQSL
tara:strand:- start:66047 stop:66214 length:168 start_codon:yes stop_codon:yes gene_type:complete